MTAVTQDLKASRRRDNSNIVVVALLLLIVGAALYSIVQDMTRQAQFGPICSAKGWVVTDTGPMAQPKCLDVKTGLMYVPSELRNR